jgi:hypothetical protein
MGANASVVVTRWVGSVPRPARWSGRNDPARVRKLRRCTRPSHSDSIAMRAFLSLQRGDPMATLDLRRARTGDGFRQGQPFPGWRSPLRRGDRKASGRRARCLCRPWAGRLVELSRLATAHRVTVNKNQIADESATLTPSHLFGHPVRFRREVTIRPEDEWASAKPRSIELRLGPATSPLLSKHGYSLSGPPSEARQ